jgi:uncharacterized protein YqfB (UPF0267 family)
MKEQRKYPRFDVVAKIMVKKLESANQAQEAFVKNISAEGFCFSSEEKFNPGDVIEVEIIEENRGLDPICTKGEVVWCSQKSDTDRDSSPGAFLTGIKVLGIRQSDEARFAMLYCERMLAELKSFLRM